MQEGSKIIKVYNHVYVASTAYIVIALQFAKLHSTISWKVSLSIFKLENAVKLSKREVLFQRMSVLLTFESSPLKTEVHHVDLFYSS